MIPRFQSNIVDLGLIYSCKITSLKEGGKGIDVKMSMTAPGCGMGNVLKADVEHKLGRLPEVKEVTVQVVFDPPWHPDRMSEAAKLQLGLDLDQHSNPRSHFLSAAAGIHFAWSTSFCFSPGEAAEDRFVGIRFAGAPATF